MSVLSLTSRTVLGISSEHGKRNRDTKNHSKNAFHNLIPKGRYLGQQVTRQITDVTTRDTAPLPQEKR